MTAGSANQIEVVFICSDDIERSMAAPLSDAIEFLPPFTLTKNT